MLQDTQYCCSIISALSVLTSRELLLYIFDFQYGVYHVHHPLRRIGSYAWDVCPSSHKLLRSSMVELNELLAPWFALHGTSRLGTFIRSTNVFRHYVVASHCAYEGNLPALQVLLRKTNSKYNDTHLIDWAACNGQMHIIQFLHGSSKGSAKCTTWAMDIAATNGHQAILEWLDSNRSEGFTIAAVQGAARNGHLDVLKWLSKKLCHEQWWVGILDIAATHGHLETVKWLHVYGKRCSVSAMNGACMNGHIKVLQWLHLNRDEGCTVAAMDGAAKNGHLNIVKWLHYNRFEGCTTAAIDNAAQNGHVDIVQWLALHRKEGFSKATTQEAKLNGHHSVFRVLKTHRKLSKPSLCALQ